MEILMFIIFGFMIVRSVIPSPTDDSNANKNRRIAVSQSDQQALVDSIGNDAFPGCFTAMTEEKFKQYEKNFNPESSFEQTRKRFFDALKKGDFVFVSPMSDSERRSLIEAIQAAEQGKESETVEKMKAELRKAWEGTTYITCFVLLARTRF
ncbi:MAG: hypothetical protein M1821_009223 [Bathelium mastoideum]|nr:MAG: hypothetical protein M1821_009223 [Bathelium mastoideum]